MAGCALIAGLGFMGGSLALALRARGWQVRLWHHREGVAEQAAHAGLGSVGALDGAWDVAIACAPVLALPTLCAQLARHGLTTDVGSTKGDLCTTLAADMAAGRFVGSHPMCGSHLTGWRHADVRLYAGARVVVCADRAAPAAEAIVSAMWRDLGCQVMSMDPARHDRAVADASHLPHVCAALAAGGLDEAEAVSLAASGFRDTTRVAGGDPALWADILIANRSEVVAAAQRARARLGVLLDLLEHSDHAGVAAWLTQARAGRQRYDARAASPAASPLTATPDRC